MKLNKSIKEEQAVSPVIGVILIVAITVILAAVIGAFVLGIGGDLAGTPNSNLGVNVDSEFSEDDQNQQRMFSVDHNGGDSLQTEDIRLIIRNEDGDRIATLANINSASDTTDDGSDVSVSFGEDTFEVGDRVDVDVTLAYDTTTTPATLEETDLVNGAELTVQLIHDPSDGVVTERTITLAS